MLTNRRLFLTGFGLTGAGVTTTAAVSAAIAATATATSAKPQVVAKPDALRDMHDRNESFLQSVSTAIPEYMLKCSVFVSAMQLHFNTDVTYEGCLVHTRIGTLTKLEILTTYTDLGNAKVAMNHGPLIDLRAQAAGDLAARRIDQRICTVLNGEHCVWYEHEKSHQHLLQQWRSRLNDSILVTRRRPPILDGMGIHWRYAETDRIGTQVSMRYDQRLRLELCTSMLVGIGVPT